MKSSAAKLSALIILVIFSLAVTLTACGQNTPVNNTPESTSTTESDAGLEPGATITSVPDPNEAVRSYLDAWKAGDYTAMYDMLTTISKDFISFEDFSQRYSHVTQEAVISDISYEILQVLTTPTNAQVSYKLSLLSSLVGMLQSQTQMNLSLENEVWKVVWDDSIIMSELAGGNRLSLETIWPTRGIIYDRNGNTLSADTRAVAISIVPSAVEEDQTAGLLNTMALVSGLPATYWSAKIFNEDNPYVMPLYEIPYSTFEEYENRISNHYNVLGATSFDTRLSYLNEAGGPSVGWVGAIPLEELDQWIAKGYPTGAQIGRSGVEAWAEESLAGKPSADLYLVTKDDQMLTRLASVETEPSQSVYTTLDEDLQLWAEESLQGFVGAAVVLERDTGRVLAIASSPTYNPNYADLNNPNSLWNNYFPDNAGYFFNRATQGQYPPGSIFKVITMSAALEAGAYQRDSVINCEHTWQGPDGIEYVDWTLEKERPASGELTLVEGLMRSCNPWFYQIGATLYSQGETSAVADMARGFGLGSPTGIDVFPEESGQINNPDDQTGGGSSMSKAIQQGIGQSDTLITPIQAAVYTAALGNGGTLYRPQMIERIENVAGENTFEFTPVENGKLPISDDTLAAVKEGMLMVTQNTRGTAYNTFINRSIKVWGKTGTAQTSTEYPHAWFIGFTDQQNENVPDIAIAVLVEFEGDGSEFGAPIFRRLMEVYFYGQPSSVFPWEKRIGEIDERYFMTPEEIEALEAEEAANNNN